MCKSKGIGHVWFHWKQAVFYFHFLFSMGPTTQKLVWVCVLFSGFEMWLWIFFFFFSLYKSQIYLPPDFIFPLYPTLSRCIQPKPIKQTFNCLRFSISFGWWFFSATCWFWIVARFFFFFLLSKNNIYTKGYSIHEKHRANSENYKNKKKKKTEKIHKRKPSNKLNTKEKES